MGERCKDMVGKRVVVTRQMMTRGGFVVEPGDLLWVLSTWRGKFELGTSQRADSTVIRAVDRRSFSLMENETCEGPLDAELPESERRGAAVVA